MTDYRAQEALDRQAEELWHEAQEQRRLERAELDRKIEDQQAEQMWHEADIDQLKRGTPTGEQAMNQEHIFDILACLENGDSINDIAADYEITVSQVRQIEFEHLISKDLRYP